VGMRFPARPYRTGICTSCSPEAKVSFSSYQYLFLQDANSQGTVHVGLPPRGAFMSGSPLIEGIWL
jgi:hypothetical protein